MSELESVGSPPPTRYSEPWMTPRARRLADRGDRGVQARVLAPSSESAATAVTSFSFEAGMRAASCPSTRTRACR